MNTLIDNINNHSLENFGDIVWKDPDLMKDHLTTLPADELQRKCNSLFTLANNHDNIYSSLFGDLVVLKNNCGSDIAKEMDIINFMK